MAYSKNGALIERINSTATSGGTLTLANNSQSYQRFTGTTTHTVVLPQANAASPNECPVGLKFVILNRSTGVITVNYNGGSLAATVAAGSQTTFRLTDNSTSTGTWDATVESVSNASASLTTNEKLATIAALGNTFYQDAETSSTTVSINPEEIGGDFWRTKQSIPISNGIRNQAVVAFNGILYSVGGDNGGGPGGVSQLWHYAFNDDNNFWLTRTGLPAIRNGLGAFSLGGKMIAAGGRATSTTGNTTLYSYSDSTGAWSTLSPVLPTAKANMPNNMVKDDLGYFIGGYVTGGATSADVSAYSAVKNAVYSRCPLPAVRYDGMGMVGPQFLHYAAGLDASPARVTTSYAYDTVLNNWRSTSAFPQARNGSPAFTTLDRGYVPSGYTNAGPPLSTQGYVYNFEIDLWSTSVASIANARYDAPAGGSEYNGSGFVLGGSTSAGPLSSILETYIPFSFFNINLSKNNYAAPNNLFVSAAFNNLVDNLPVRIRTDGLTWKFFKANTDSTIKGAGAGIAEGVTELVTNGTFNTDLSGWTSNNLGASTNTWQSPGYALLSRNANQQDFYQIISTVAGQRYRLSFTVSTVTGGGGLFVEAQDGTSVAPGGTPNIVSLSNITQDGTYYLDFVALSSNTILNFHMEVAGTCSCRLDNVSLKTASMLGADSLTSKFSQVKLPSYTGGSNGSALTNNKFYNSVSDTWVTKTAQAAARMQQHGFTLNGKGYVLQGYDGSTQVNENKYFDDFTNAFTTKTNAPSASRDGAGADLNGFGYLHNTATASNTTDATQRFSQYNPTTDAFVSKAVSTIDVVSAPMTSIGGRLWIAGGANLAASTVQNNQMYVADTNTWVQKTVVGFNHMHHSGFALSDKNYVVGGESSGSPTNGIETYNIVSDSWTHSGSGTGDLPVSMEEHTSFTGVGPEVGYVLGGWTGSLTARFYQFNPYSLAWTTKTNDGAVAFSAKGFASASYYNYQFQIGLPTYLAAAGNYTAVTRAPIPANQQDQGVGSINGFMIPGHAAAAPTYRYDLATDSWMRVGDSTDNFDNASGFSLGGLGFVSGRAGTASNITSVLNPITWTWTVGATLTAARAAAKAASLDGRGYLVAGIDTGSTRQSNVQIYNPNTNAWVDSGGSIITARYAHSVASFQGYIYLAGDQAQSTSVERWNPMTATSTAVAVYPTAIAYHEMKEFNGYMFGVGGFNGANISNMYAYNNTSNIWISKPNFNTARNSIATGVFGDTMMLSGGNSGTANEAYQNTIKNIVLGAALRIN